MKLKRTRDPNQLAKLIVDIATGEATHPQNTSTNKNPAAVALGGLKGGKARAEKLIEVGTACSKYQDKALRNLPCKRIQLDEIWAFCYAKQKNVPNAKSPVGGADNIWTWTAICADTKLIPSWTVGNRDAESAQLFITDLASRLKNAIQLTSDGCSAHLEAIESAFGANIDYAMLIKLYGETRNGEKGYIPSEYRGAKKKVVSGSPAIDKVSTSYVECQNLTIRMGMHRFTCLTNAFSKKAENHAYAVALHFMYYNFGRIHKTLRVSPVMEAGVDNHLWSLEEIAALADKKSNSDTTALVMLTNS